jgi:hypothetical protein
MGASIRVVVRLLVLRQWLTSQPEVDVRKSQKLVHVVVQIMRVQTRPSGETLRAFLSLRCGQKVASFRFGNGWDRHSRVGDNNFQVAASHRIER